MEQGCYFRVGTELWFAYSVRDAGGVVTTTTELIDPLFFPADAAPA